MAVFAKTDQVRLGCCPTSAEGENMMYVNCWLITFVPAYRSLTLTTITIKNFLTDFPPVGRLVRVGVTNDFGVTAKSSADKGFLEHEGVPNTTSQ
jgi:hypothetical protein